MKAGRRVTTTAALLVALFAARPILALDPSRALTQYVHEWWATEAGLPQATVRAVLQTRDGYLWVGTEEGLARFDGVRFTVFNRQNIPELRSNHVLSLLEDRAGNLWIGTHGGGLVWYRDGAFSILTRKDGLGGDFVYALDEDRDGTLWIGVRSSVSRLRAGRLEAFSDPNLVGGTIWSIRHDAAGAMWIGSDLHGLTRIANGAASAWTTANGLPHNAIPVILPLRDGRVVIGTNGAGLFEWSDGRFIPFRAKGALPSASVTALLEDAAGNLWIGTAAGLARATGGVIVSGAPGELGNSPINALFEDREGSLWIGTSGAGLHRLRDGKVRMITAADGLPSDRVRVVFHDRSGAAWIGTRDGLARIAGGHVDTWSTRNGLPNDSVTALFQSSDGAMWIGTDLGGVVRMAGDRMETTILDPDVPDNAVRAFAEQPGAGVWVGTNGGRLTLFAGGAPAHRIEPGPGSPRFFVRALAAAKDGSLWVATDGNGLYQLVDGKVRQGWSEDNGLSRNGLRSLLIDGGGTVWVGTDGGGLDRLQNGRITVYDMRQGLFDDVVLQIVEGGDGRLWMSSHNGIFAADRRSLDAFAQRTAARVGSLYLNDRDGMLSRDCSGGSQPAGAKSADGRLWFPTNAGVVVVDPKHIPVNRQPPPVYVEKVVAEGMPITGKDAFELPRGTKNVEISYTALSLVVPQRVRFRYKLEGYDEHWVDAGSRRTAYYTALRPGRYAFRVIAANDDGVWNRDGARVQMVLPAYFYQQRWFALLVLALIGAAIWAGVTMRIRSIRREAARTADMERRLVIAQRMDALGQMATGIAHDFNNTLMAAYPWADLIRRQYPDDYTLQKAAEKITAAVERAKKVTAQLLDFAHPKHSEGAPLDLGQVARDAVSMARALIPPEIDVRTVADPQRLVVSGDEAKLAQVLLNLLLNARDAMPNGGAVTVEVRERGESALLSVRDTGSGMDPAVIARIFDPFFTTKDVGKGTGLGLAVVHRIVRDHGGTIQVESAPGKGSTFHILLPKSKVDLPPAADAAVPPISGALRGLKVLLVDDEAVIVEIIQQMLGMEGVDVSVATSGPEALRRLDEGWRPDLVILDLGLPELSGERVHALLRERLPNLPIIISSGYDDRERIDPLLRDAKTAYLQKPYPIEDLIRRIAAMTGRAD